MEEYNAYVGMDDHKDTIAVALPILEDGRIRESECISLAESTFL